MWIVRVTETGPGEFPRIEWIVLCFDIALLLARFLEEA